MVDPLPQYAFKAAARIPSTISADAVVEERERVIEQWGKSAIPVVATAVLSAPQDFPALAQLIPHDPEEAMLFTLESRIRHVFGAIVPVKVQIIKGQPKTVIANVRLLHSVHDDEGETIYERLDVIARNPRQYDELLDTIRRDATNLYEKLMEVLDELKELNNPTT